MSTRCFGCTAVAVVALAIAIGGTTTGPLPVLALLAGAIVGAVVLELVLHDRHAHEAGEPAACRTRVARQTVVIGGALGEIDRDTLRRKIEAGDDFVLVDASPAIAFAGAHLPGAINIPPDRVETLLERRIPDPDTEVVVYCANPDCESSVEVAERLVELGYTRVSRCAGGKQDWRGAGLPLEGGRI